jgi:para-aminobenzoate synthetase / 4-amino-4-deoxychorismate lyase
VALPGDADTFVLIENSRPRGFGDGRSLLFTGLDQVVECSDLSEVSTAFEQIETAAADGLFAAGYMSYELGYGLEGDLAKQLPETSDVPLVWFGLFRQCTVLDQAARARFWADRKGRRFAVENVTPSIAEAEYLAAVEQVHAHLRRGDAYQINLTFKLEFDVTGDPFALMHALSRRQPVEYGAFINTPDRKILSLSPELFLSKAGTDLTSRPMKGTWPRGVDLEDDGTQVHNFSNDEKTRAENLMIVDLIRNDLSRISRPGSVQVSDPFAIETYRTLFQMTSTVHAEAIPNLTFAEAVHAMYPCGSITGVPKIRAMNIIRELEAAPRGAYTGAIGYVAQGQEEAGADFCFNVPIRTLCITNDGRSEMGIGSGIVADSDAKAEYRECLLKAQFLTDLRPDFQLIETMLWRPKGGIWLLELHLDRLRKSAAYFQIPLDEGELREMLERHGAASGGEVPRRVRLLLDDGGRVSLTSEEFAPMPAPHTVRMSTHITRSDDMFLLHKTTDRALYTSELAAARRAGHLDTIFVNERGELTEGTVTNLFVEKDGLLRTPPIDCGLLPGVLRAHLFEDPARLIREEVLSTGDLVTADKVYVGNSVIGLVEVTMVDYDRPSSVSLQD